MSSVEEALERTVQLSLHLVDLVRQFYPTLEAFITFRTPYVRDVAIGKYNVV